MMHASRAPRRAASFVLLAFALAASAFTAVTLPAPPAEARYATHGTGAYRGSIDWFEWGAHRDAIPAGGLTRTNEREVAGRMLRTTCTIGAVSGGGLIAYRPGSWGGDGFDDMYRIQGPDGSNTLITGLANAAGGTTISFSFACSATLDGTPVPLAGLVMADAEQSASNEYVQATIPVGGQWRLIDRHRTAGCASDTTVTRTGATLRLTGPAQTCNAGPNGVAFMEDATSAAVTLKGGGVSAIALGVMLFNDFGDAPASYGEAGAIYSPNFTGNPVPQGDSTLFGATLNTPTQPATRLGATVDAEANHQPNADASADGADEDAIASPGTVRVTPGATHTLPDVQCTGPGTVAGWIDWNRDGDFDSDERSTPQSCTGSSVVLTWDVPTDAAAGASFLRLRGGPDAASVATPTGVTTAGEVEDYPLTLAPRGDFGDAPDSAGTTLGTSGARHALPSYDPATQTAPVMLGTHVDIEDDGAPGAPADGDDTAGVDDEDGVAFNSALGYPNPTIRTGPDPVTLEPVTNHLTVNASAAGFVSVWVDWNLDGDFADDGERVADARPVTPGDNEVTFSRATNPGDIHTYVRVRYSTDAGAIHSPTGPAPDGEVEDYRVLVERLITPAACSAVTEPYYAMTFNSVTEKTGAGAPGTSARYPNVSVVKGEPVDLIAQTGSPGNTINANGFFVANGDDAAWNLNGSGAAVVVTFSWVKAGTTTPVPFNSIWTVNDMDSGERADFVSPIPVAGYAVTPGSQVSVTMSGGRLIFAGTVSGNGDVRSRWQAWFQDKTSVSAIWRGFGNSGFFVDGDNDINMPKSCDDYGDAPDSYKTLLGSDGPHHTVTPGLRLGASSEFDADGQPGPTANGDDTNRTDDEDGVADPITMTTGDPTTVRVQVTNDTGSPATLAGWLDLDGDGTFGAGERVVVPVTTQGASTQTVTFPPGTTTTATYARFRLFPGDITDPAPTGPAPAGEVEDYPVTVLTRGLELTKSSTGNADSRPGDTITYTITATNTGNGAFTEANPARVVDDLTAVLDDAVWNDDASATVDGNPAGTVGLDSPRLLWSGPLAAGATVEITYTVTLEPGGDGTVRNVAWAPPIGTRPGPTPDCEDPANTLPCADTEFLLPKLRITKAASRNDLPAVGGEITYTVSVRNVGPGTLSAAEPALFTDDLSDVEDDADLVGTPSASSGTPSYGEPELSWTGALGVGNEATVTYTFRYTGAGDQSLVNAACVPAGLAADPDDRCGRTVTPGSGLDQAKTANPAAGSAVDAGDEVTYTLRFTNTGQAPATVDTVDDLSGVVDDAELLAGTIDAEGGLSATYDQAGSRLVVTGTVPVGETLLIRYTVRVRAFAAQDDHVLRNALACQPGDPATCEPETTQHPVRHLRVSKTSDAQSGADTGDEVTYTVTVHNDGEGDYTLENPASVLDDLSDVVDDATFDLADVTVSGGGRVTLAGGVLTWSGPLAEDATVTIVYTVTVTNLGDHDLVNAATGGECQEGDESCAPPPVDTPLPHVVPSKTSDPASGTNLAGGQEVTYTLSWTNDGQAAGVVDATDDASGVLDDAELVDGPHSFSPGVTAAFTGSELRVTGPIPAGQTVTVTYQVRVRPDGERGDNLARNLLTPDTPQVECETGEGGRPECTPVEPPATEHQIGELHDWKTVDPASGALVQAGDEVTYTLHFTNTGTAPVEVGREDVLAGVLDDAVLVGRPTASSPSLTVTGPVDRRIRVTGTLAPEQTATVVYTVRVKPSNRQGDRRLGNFLVDPGDEPPASCSVHSPQRGPAGTSDCTLNLVRKFDLTLAKRTVSGPRATVGDRIRYQLTVSNRGPHTATEPIRVVDKLPRGLELVSAHGRSWTCRVNKAADTAACVRNQRLFSDGKAAPIFVIARATTAAIGGRLVNTAQVSAHGDTTRANNRDGAEVRVAQVPPSPNTGYRHLIPNWF